MWRGIPYLIAISDRFSRQVLTGGLETDVYPEVYTKGFVPTNRTL